MAQRRIQGITIAINADTSGVTSGLKDLTDESIQLSKHPSRPGIPPPGTGRPRRRTAPLLTGTTGTSGAGCRQRGQTLGRSHHTGQTIEKIYQDTERDNYMSAQQAVEYGLIDKVI